MTRGIFVVGTSQAVAAACARERLHVDLDEVHGAMQRLLDAGDVVDEAVPLATCARLELYGVSSDPGRACRLLRRLVAQRTGVDAGRIRELTYELHGEEAVRHLFRVAAGLDSVVHGEAQILGQVRAAAFDPRLGGGKGPVLHRLFDTALATGKQVRSETQIGRGAASLAGAALQMVRGRVGALDRATALVVGAGETGALVARLLTKGGVGRLIVANRTLDTAEATARPLGGEAVGLEAVSDLIDEVDLLVGAASVPEPLLTGASLAPLVAGRDRPLWLLDLAHPRNFDHDVTALHGVELFDLDHVFERIEAARTARSAQVPAAESIVLRRAEEFEAWARSRRSVGVLRAVRAHVLELAHGEAERHSRGRSDEDRQRMHRLARSVARTLLHHPTVALRGADPVSPEGRRLLESAPALFGLDNGEAAAEPEAD